MRERLFECLSARMPGPSWRWDDGMNGDDGTRVEYVEPKKKKKKEAKTLVARPYEDPSAEWVTVTGVGDQLMAMTMAMAMAMATCTREGECHLVWGLARSLNHSFTHSLTHSVFDTPVDTRILGYFPRLDAQTRSPSCCRFRFAHLLGTQVGSCLVGGEKKESIGLLRKMGLNRPLPTRHPISASTNMQATTQTAWTNVRPICIAFAFLAKPSPAMSSKAEFPFEITPDISISLGNSCPSHPHGPHHTTDNISIQRCNPATEYRLALALPTQPRSLTLSKEEPAGFE
ncbi:hypothetical protein X797_000432 [Metarhizium robertsii]|uniref:Uncharacterized protein n=1 Tax=Metarhizium robertsii TaxID=568076 RepID=A0A0A1V760_9HYPO|nr:hypothetical protein X797_000432 [Metarhizium robertsii]